MAKWEILVKEEGDWSEEEVTRGLQAFLICVEMFPLSIAFFKTFGYSSFREPLVSMSYGDKSVISNFAHIANVRDVIDDTIISMKKGPKRNVQAGDFMALSREDQLKRSIYLFIYILFFSLFFFIFFSLFFFIFPFFYIIYNIFNN